MPLNSNNPIPRSGTEPFRGGSVLRSARDDDAANRQWKKSQMLVEQLESAMGNIHNLQRQLQLATGQEHLEMPAPHPFQIYQREAPYGAGDWRQFVVRAGLYGHLHVATGTDGVEDPWDVWDVPDDTALVTCDDDVLKHWFWVHHDGAGNVEVKNSSDPESDGWSGYPVMDEDHIPIGWVDTKTKRDIKAAVVRQIVKYDILVCHLTGL